MNIDEFKKTLEDTPWWVTNIFDDVDDVANAWELLYKAGVDINFLSQLSFGQQSLTI